MRQQGQQNRRGRNRNNGRKIQNPLTRNYDSSGPDVKIRGTASHIAEKYTSLARDALSSGDTVSAENLFQHAEHYNRIIMSAQQPDQPDVQPVISDHANGLDGSSDVSDAHLKPVDGKSAEDGSGEKKQDRSRGRSAKGNGTANNRRRRRRPNGNGATAKGNAETAIDDSPSSEQIAPAKKEKPVEAETTPQNGALH